MNDDVLVEVIVTAPDRDWLIDLCRQLVDEQLAASAHIIHPITSIYRWDGSVHETTEARAFLRSRHSLLAELTAYVLAHPPARDVHIRPIRTDEPQGFQHGGDDEQDDEHRHRLVDALGERAVLTRA